MRPFTMTPGGAYWSRRRLSVRRTRSRAAGIRSSVIGSMSGMASRAGVRWRTLLAAVRAKILFSLSISRKRFVPSAMFSA